MEKLTTLAAIENAAYSKEFQEADRPLVNIATRVYKDMQAEVDMQEEEYALLLQWKIESTEIFTERIATIRTDTLREVLKYIGYAHAVPDTERYNTLKEVSEFLNSLLTPQTKENGQH